MTPRQVADPPAPPADPPAGGFSDEEKAELKAMIAEAVGASTPPPSSDPVRPTDDEWDGMTDRQKESWVRKVVDSQLDKLSLEDEAARLRAENDALKTPKKPEPEGSPTGSLPPALSRVQKWLWGDQS